MLKDGYKEIKIGASEEGVKVEFDDDTPSVEVEKEPIVEDVKLEEVIPEVKKEEEVKLESIEKVKPKKVSRSQKRIRQLNTEKQEAVQRALEAEAEKEVLKKQIKEGNKSSQISMKDTLENQVKVLTSSMKEAMQSGDSDSVVTLQDSLINAKMELATINRDLKANESVVVESESPQQPVQPQLPEKAMDWLDEHPSFNTDEVFHAVTVVVNNQLLREGFDVNSEDFYEELDKRLSSRFPEEFGVSTKNSVESKEDTKLSNDEADKDVKDKSSSTELPRNSLKTRSVEQTVSGSSRPSTMAVNSPVKKNSVTLSPEDVEQADRWGISLEQMARRVAHTEKNRREDGYVPIRIG